MKACVSYVPPNICRRFSGGSLLHIQKQVPEKCSSLHFAAMDYRSAEVARHHHRNTHTVIRHSVPASNWKKTVITKKKPSFFLAWSQNQAFFWNNTQSRASGTQGLENKDTAPAETVRTTTSFYTSALLVSVCSSNLLLCGTLRGTPKA